MNIFKVFTSAKTVLNPKAWKRGQITVPVLLPVLMALASLLKGTPYELPDALVLSLATVIVGAVNWAITVATTDKLDILGRTPKPVDSAAVAGKPGQPPPSEQGPLDTSVGGITADTVETARLWAQRQATGPTSDNMP